jgi:hypothetical protein
MRSSVRWVVVICVACAMWMPVLARGASEAAGDGRGELTFELSADRPVELPDRPWTPRVLALPGPDEEKAALRLSIPNFTNSISVGGRRYTFTELGADPSRNHAPNTAIPILIIPVRAQFDDGTVLDATAPDSCAGGVAPTTLVEQSPIFQGVDYGDGSRQYVEEFRRLEFWALTGGPGGRNPNYSVTVAHYWLPTLIINFHGFPTQKAPCGRLGLLELNQWNSFVQRTLFPQLHQYGAGPGALVLFLLSNVGFYNGNQKSCCTLGYHSWFTLHGVQTYGVAEYDSTQAFSGISDVGVLAHELAEWYDDPLGNNATPRWGHVGQVSGCQANLEVGDPLSGHFLEVTMPNGVLYHPQELAFFSWFFGQTPSLGFDGWYSMAGTFRTPAAPCH